MNECSHPLIDRYRSENDSYGCGFCMACNTLLDKNNYPMTEYPEFTANSFLEVQ